MAKFSQYTIYILVIGNTLENRKSSSKVFSPDLTSSVSLSTLPSLFWSCLLLALIFPIHRLGPTEYFGLLELTRDLIDWILDGSGQKF